MARRFQGCSEQYVIDSLARDGFEPVYVSTFGQGRYFYEVRCVLCGHKLKKEQHIWQLRHGYKHLSVKR